MMSKAATRSPTLNRPIVELLGSVVARSQAPGIFRRGADTVDIHMAVAALGVSNATNQFTFGALFQRDMGARGDFTGRRGIVADIILSWLVPARAPAHRNPTSLRS
jgi:hypothetical protein